MFDWQWQYCKPSARKIELWRRHCLPGLPGWFTCMACLNSPVSPYAPRKSFDILALYKSDYYYYYYYYYYLDPGTSFPRCETLSKVCELSGWPLWGLGNYYYYYYYYYYAVCTTFVRGHAGASSSMNNKLFINTFVAQASFFLFRYMCTAWRAENLASIFDFSHFESLWFQKGEIYQKYKNTFGAPIIDQYVLLNFGIVGSTQLWEGYEIAPRKNGLGNFAESLVTQLRISRFCCKLVGWKLVILLLKPRMAGGTGGLNWQCILNCRLF